MKIVGQEQQHPKSDEQLKAEQEARERLAKQSHPFVQGLGNAGAILGRDIAVLALRSMESLKQPGGLNAALYWPAEFIPAAIKVQMTPEMIEGALGAMIVPAHVTVSGLMFEGTTRSASRGLVDGSQLIVFEKVATPHAAGQGKPVAAA